MRAEAQRLRDSGFLLEEDVAIILADAATRFDASSWEIASP